MIFLFSERDAIDCLCRTLHIFLTSCHSIAINSVSPIPDDDAEFIGL